LPIRQRPVKSPGLRLTFSSSFELEESVAGEVEVAEGSTRTRHHLLELLLLLIVIPKAILLLVVVLVVVVSLQVVVLIGGVEFFPLGTVGNEVGGVATLEAAPR
jgi:hypothetical protein